MKRIKTQNALASAELKQGLRLLARKYGVSPDKVMGIIVDWQRWQEKNTYLIAVRKVRSKIYSRVLRVLCPIEFYWFGDKFDGCSIDVSKCRLSEYQKRLMDTVLDVIVPDATETLEPSGVPPVIKRIFGERL